MGNPVPIQPLRPRAAPYLPRRPRAIRGQALVELALTLPVLLLIALVVIDFGRLFLGWVNLQNMARVAANYAAQYPDAWSTANPNPSAQAQYVLEIQNDASTINCALPSSVPTPSFSGTAALGQDASVVLTCQFQVLTPVISAIVGNPVTLGASAVFPIRVGVIIIATPTPNPTATPTATPTPTPTATPALCTVPSFILDGTKANAASGKWGAAKFQLPLLVTASTTNNYTIRTEYVGGNAGDWDGTQQPCDTFQLTVGP